MKVEKKKDRRKQDKPQKSEELVPHNEEEITENENSTDECDDDFSSDPNFDLSTFTNDSEYDPYSDEPRRLRCVSLQLRLISYNIVAQFVFVVLSTCLLRGNTPFSEKEEKNSTFLKNVPYVTKF